MGLPAELVEVAASIRALVFDVDGVLTDGRLYYGAEGEALKVFHSRDGFGMKLIQAEGVEVGIITARQGSVLKRRLDDLGIVHRLVGREDKRQALEELAGALGIGLGAIAFVGDDVIDLPALRAVGLSITVADGHPKVKREVDWVTSLPGGLGAAREVVDALLEARGRLDAACEEMLSRLHER